MFTRIKVAIVAIATFIATVFIAPQANAAASGTVTCSGMPVVGVWITVVSGPGTSGWAWTPNDGRHTQPYYRADVEASTQFKVSVGCGGTPSSWDTPTHSTATQSSPADWVCYPGYVTGAWNKCYPS